jgi:hypothetical protein
VYPENPDIVATVGSSFQAGWTMTARPIGLDGAPVSLLDEILIRGCMQDLARKFMT